MQSLNLIIQEPANVLDKRLIDHQDTVKLLDTEYAIKKNKIDISVPAVRPLPETVIAVV